MLLGIPLDDSSKDAMINYWIGYYSRMIGKYTHNCDKLEDGLVDILEQAVVDKMGSYMSSNGSTLDTQGKVKSITRGDYSVTYFSGAESQSSSSSDVLDDVMGKYQSQLNLYRRFSY